MPSHKIHLAIARKLNYIFDVDLDALMLGSVLPDLTINKEHGSAHFQVEGSYESELANPDKFVKKYISKLSNPLYLGYLCHILTDRFYNDYFFTNYCVIENEKVIYVKLKNNKLEKNVKRFKQGDFGIYDKWLLNHKYVNKFKSDKVVERVEDLEEAKFDKKYIRDYIDKHNNDVDHIPIIKFNFKKYNVLSKEECDVIFNKCCNYIINYMEEVKEKYGKRRINRKNC